MIQFYKETYATVFEFDDLKDVQFSHYYTDNGYEDAYYDIDLSLLPIESGKNYIFSFYRFKLGSGGPQIAEDFGLRYSFGEDFCIQSLDILDKDKNGNNYPTGVTRLYWNFTATSSTKIIKIRLTPRVILLENCKTINGEEPFLNPNGFSRSFYAYGFQLEESIDSQIEPSDYFPSIGQSIEIGISPNTSQSFQYFIYKLYGIEGVFINEPTKYFQENDKILKEKRRLDCGSTPCFETKNDLSNNYLGSDKFKIYKYKGVPYAISDIFDFFQQEIVPYLSSIKDLNFPKLYTDFEKLYFIGQKYNPDGSKNGELVYKTFEKSYGNAVIEIINLLIKYKNFDNQNIADGNKVYILPIPFPGSSNTPIKDEDFDNIVFTGFLNKPVDLNIQAGFCRYYLNPETAKPKISGYFYETSDFFDVKNTQLINENNTYLNIFPSQIEKINQIPSFYIPDIRKLNFSRLIKNDSSVNFTKILNYTGYVESCYFRELKIGVSVQLTGNYITNRRMSDVWGIQIKSAQNSPIDDVSLGVTEVGVKEWTFKNFGPIKNSLINSKYLKIIHKNIEVNGIPLRNTARVELTSTSNGIKYPTTITVL